MKKKGQEVVKGSLSLFFLFTVKKDIYLYYLAVEEGGQCTVKRFSSFVSTGVQWISRIGQFGLVAAMLIIVGNIVLRLIWRPIPGSYELVGISGALLFSGGVAYCAFERGHIAVDIVMRKLTERGQRIIAIIVGLISLFFATVLGYNTLLYAGRIYSSGDRLGHLPIPRYPFVYIVAIGLFVWSFVLLHQIVESMVHSQRGKA